MLFLFMQYFLHYSVIAHSTLTSPFVILEESDMQLVLQAQQDKEAFGLLYDKYAVRIFSYVGHRLPIKADAEDVTTVIWMKALQNLHRFSPNHEYSFVAWLFRIAHTSVIDFCRKKAVHPETVSLDDVIPLADEQLSPNDALAHKEQFLHLYRAIEQLPPQQSEVVRLRYVSGLANKEIAKILSISEKTVASNLYRGMTKLKGLLEINAVKGGQPSFQSMTNSSF